MEYLEWKQRLRELVLEKLDYGRECSDSEVLERIDEVILQQGELKLLPVAVQRQLRTDLFDSLRRLDILQNLIEDSGITEIMINGPNHVFFERNGHLRELETGFESSEKLMDVIQQIVAG